MQLQEFDPKVISITQLRRDIDALEEVLEREREALVMRNQEIFFIALSPEKYREVIDKESENKSLGAAAQQIHDIRAEYGVFEGKSKVSDYVSQMRDQRIKKWKK